MKLLLTFTFSFSLLCSFAQNTALEQAKILIEDKKYESAYNLLDSADPENKEPEIVIAKTDLLLEYFVSSIMHQMFAVTDLQPEQDILDLRGSEGSFTMVSFTPDSVLLDLIEAYPENYELRRTLGAYYHDVYIRYAGRWFISGEELMGKFNANYLLAYENGVMDYRSTFGIGFAYLVVEKYAEAIPFLEESTALNPDYPTSHYNLAYAYMQMDRREDGIASAQKALGLYDDLIYKADAAQLIAVLYNELDNSEKAIEYYRIANEIDAGDYSVMYALLDLEVTAGKDGYQDRTSEFFTSDPENPTIYQDLLRIYLTNDKGDELLSFLTTQLPTYEENDLVSANLQFYLGVTYFELKDLANAKPAFEQASQVFGRVFEPDHPVFEVINSYLEQME
ncbi:MAG: tetratricopeptide repeat protein [Bacteroidota bacterium]